eukprot:c22071_g1_i2 orf=360-1493(+)
MRFAAISVLCLKAFAAWILFFWGGVKANGIGSIVFMEGKPGQYLRGNPWSTELQETIFSKADIFATVSVLLGVEPPSSIDQDCADKLDKLLSPDPFNRPHVIWLLTVGGLETDFMNNGACFGINSIQQHKFSPEDSNPTLRFPDDVKLHLLQNSEENEVHSIGAEQKLKQLSLFLGGSYQQGKDLVQGTITVPLPSGAMATFDLSKEADQTFALELSSFFQSVTKAAILYEGRDLQNSAEIFVATFSGIEGLRRANTSTATTLHASELLKCMIGKLFSYMEQACNGHLVGVIAVPSFSIQKPVQEIFDIKLSLRYVRRLDELSSSNYTTIIAEALAEKIIAYFTGILLVLAVIIGSCYLFKMPLTRDTLLYSGAKLD